MLEIYEIYGGQSSKHYPEYQKSWTVWGELSRLKWLDNKLVPYLQVDQVGISHTNRSVHHRWHTGPVTLRALQAYIYYYTSLCMLYMHASSSSFLVSSESLSGYWLSTHQHQNHQSWSLSSQAFPICQDSPLRNCFPLPKVNATIMPQLDIF